MRFLDASAVAKGYQVEEHSTQVRVWLSAGNAAVSRLTEVEVASALGRLGRTGAVPVQRAQAALMAFRSDVVRWQVVELTPDVVSTAIHLHWGHALRAGDAIQLASALVLQRELGQPLDAFVTYDRRLAAAARDEQLTVINS